ncbi:galectin-4-like [Oppia nitens]|uniref:galectin-4-like n=1 Tax=Oppia nitens TaxID=1686743 RepID=UPI0023DA2ABF|nr:galectin-4-like [Oppia nitens]
MSDCGQFVPEIIKRPFIPFWQLLEPGVDVNTCVIVRGRVPRFANQFTLSFIVGQEISSVAHNCADIALQFNPHFDDEDGYIVNNSRIGTHWGPQEKPRNDFPFARKQWFEVKFVFKESFVKILINGSDYGLYIYRIPIQYIGIFSIEGDVEVESVIIAKDILNGFNHQKTTSHKMLTNGDKVDTPSKEIQIKQEIDHNLNLYTSRHSIVSNMVLSQKTIYYPPIPFCQPVYNCLRNGMTITINGQVFKTPKSFQVCLQCSPNSDGQPPNVAIAITVDFDNKQVVRKSRIDNKWTKNETTLQHFPFKTNTSEQFFEIKIDIIDNRFRISVNGHHSCDYISQLIDFTTANMLEIDGDLQLIYVKTDSSQVD